jgi:hypothetical protein
MSVPVGVTDWTPCATPWPSTRHEKGADFHGDELRHVSCSEP